MAQAKFKQNLIGSGVNIVDTSGSTVRLNKLISDKGGQGDVYHVTYRGEDYALKWYNKQEVDVIGGDQYNTIKGLIGKCPGEEYIWPMHLVTEENPADGKMFGYLMKLLPSGYYEMQDFLKAADDPTAAHFESYNAILTAGMNLAQAMRRLHLQGLAYKDLNPKNLMIRPKDGHVLVVDNDNVSVGGSLCTVRGTRGYMAPEIVRTKYKKSPDRYTDFYSLAVILYKLFYVDHPMDGALFTKYPVCTDQVEDLLYAIKPVFQFHPTDESNRPCPGFAPNSPVRWASFPNTLREMFTDVFTEGIDTPAKRPTEQKWINVISDAKNRLILLPNGHEQFVTFDNPKTIPPRTMKLEVKTVSGIHSIAIYPRKAIFKNAIGGKTEDYSSIGAGIVYNKEANEFRIKNLTSDTWVGFSPKDGSKSQVAPGAEYPIYDNTQILFSDDGKNKVVGKFSDLFKK